jgi:hypothetical protein
MPSTRRTVHIEANIAWRASYNPSTKRWLGVCPEVNLTMEADSLDELYSLIEESMDLLMIDLLEDDELDAYLRERGWTATGGLPARGEAADVDFEVPWQLIAERARDPERRAR